ncbi:MAG TPA: TerC family protein [Gemmataceae bacterium]|nr:TerC family protein [Gemmataceae bacterium]
MPRRPLPLFTLVLGLVAVYLGFTGPRQARAEGPPDAKGAVTVEVPAPEFQKVRVAPADRGTPAIEGTLRLSAIPLRTGVGTQVIDAKHVRRVTFQRDPQGNSQDTVQLESKEIIRGRVTIDRFEVETADGVKTLEKAQLREIRMVRDEKLSLAAILIGLLTLSAMEIVLGIDNVIFLAIVAGKLPKEQQPKARRIGLAAALGTRLLLLFSLSFLLGLTTPIFTLPDLPLMHDLEAREVSWRDVILLAGGLFLIGKSVFEMHEKIEHAKAERAGQPASSGAPAGFAWTIVTIAVIDIVFSLDSVITAVGMVEQIWVMVIAMVIAMLVMLWFSGPIAEFVDRHPTIKVLALAFLILIGVMLVAEGLGQHIDKGYIYFAMAFGVGVELVNMRLRRGKREGEKGRQGEGETAV